MKGEALGPDIDIGLLFEADRMSGLQRQVIALCCMATFLDGYDTQALGLAVPRISEAWGLPPSAFAAARGSCSVDDSVYGVGRLRRRNRCSTAE